MRQIVSEMTAGLQQGPDNLNEKVESPPESWKKIGKTATKTRAQEIPETTVKQLKNRKESIENSMEDVEVAEKELGKERDQMDDAEKMEEGPKLMFEKSSDCNDNTVLNETASGKNELAADRTPNALKSDDFPVSLGRHSENMGYLDRATPPFSRLRPKSEGKISIRICLRTICPRLINGRHFLLIGRVSKLIVLGSTNDM